MKPRAIPPLLSGASLPERRPPRIAPVVQPAKPPPVPWRGSRRTDWKFLHPKNLKALKNLLFAARIIVEGTYTGRHKSPYRGSSPEFVDYGGAAYKGVLPTSEVSKLDYACYLAAALAYLMVKQGDKVSLALFDTKLERQIPPGGTFPHLYEILNTLEREKAGQRTSISRILQEAYPLYKRRGLLIVISDFLDEPEEIFRALNRYRHRHFEIILFHVLHQYEYELPPLDRVKFVDAETGETIA